MSNMTELTVYWWEDKKFKEREFMDIESAIVFYKELIKHNYIKSADLKIKTTTTLMSVRRR